MTSTEPVKTNPETAEKADAAKGPFEKIEEVVVGGYNKIEETVVDGYNKLEKAVVGSYTKVENSFVDRFLTKDGETVEEAKARLKKPQNDRTSEG